MRKPDLGLAEIKFMMEPSTRFISLSGLSGILVSIYALIAVGLAYSWIYCSNPPY